MIVAVARRHPWWTVVAVFAIGLAVALVVFVYGGTQSGEIGVAIA